uniref:lycopene beta-cyclase n=1 Tax=Heterosiphonia pulchra TaxID=189631 RepID=A0A2H4YKG5_9FLOR|nr:lycopene epsilon-cyclase [Heterosiphonia pulchra]
MAFASNLPVQSPTSSLFSSAVCPTRSHNRSHNRQTHRRRVPTASTATPISEQKRPSPSTSASPKTLQSDASPEIPLYDVLVVGAGPAGLSLAAALSQMNVSVCCVDRSFNNPWPNHYGVWRDEFQRVGFEDCATDRYDTTVIQVGGPQSNSASDDSKISVDRSYIRVDRVMLKEKLIRQCEQNGVRFVRRNVQSLQHVCPQWSQISLERVSSEKGPDANPSDDESSPDLEIVRSRIVADCTGHAVAFTSMDEDRSHGLRTWYQAAYGIEAEVKSYPYEKDEMVLMDFRDAHMTSDAERDASQRQPTFLYVFPGGEKRAFFEETSVIQNEAVSFEELKDRLYKRLEYDGIEVERVIEEELSFIPLGGLLPDLSQRVIAFGGAALLVHPATGYMVGRTMNLAQRLAQRLKDSLQSVGPDGDVGDVSKACWEELWGVKVRRQRDFLVFGAELLESLDMDESRAFFKAFFRLPRDLWARFLAYELETPQHRAMFAFMFFVVADNNIRVRLLRAMFEIGKWRMARSVLPEWLTADQD